MVKITVEIDGMMCGMCEAHINDAVRQNFKVKKVTSFHSKSKTEILAEIPLDHAKLKEIIDKSGYTVTGIHTGPDGEKGFSLFHR